MPRSEARLGFDIWEGLKGRSDQAKLAYAAVLTEPSVTQCGVGALRKSLWCKKLEWPVDKLDAALSELDEHRFVFVDEDTEEVLVRTLIRNDKVDRMPFVLKNALKASKLVQSKRLRHELAEELRKLDSDEAHATADELDGMGKRRTQPSAKGSKTVPEPSEKGTAERPPSRCPMHQAKSTSKPCRACAAARRTAEEWDTQRQSDANTKTSSEARTRAAEKRAAIDACDRCDEDGYDDRAVCDHKTRPKIVRRTS
ncbi:hypothetical protein [Amycolatopsis sp. NPDC059657]|uniref:hypothetical protein n=1 Tax=Amycolatopsis sp. NPDC059657 TaxID=3346899 RepID=UPI00366F8982